MIERMKQELSFELTIGIYLSVYLFVECLTSQPMFVKRSTRVRASSRISKTDLFLNLQFFFYKSLFSITETNAFLCLILAAPTITGEFLGMCGGGE